MENSKLVYKSILTVSNILPLLVSRVRIIYVGRGIGTKHSVTPRARAAPVLPALVVEAITAEEMPIDPKTNKSAIKYAPGFDHAVGRPTHLSTPGALLLD